MEKLALAGFAKYSQKDIPTAPLGSMRDKKWTVPGRYKHSYRNLHRGPR
jgi:hypothetical protein